MTTRTLLSGALRPPAPLPYRPPAAPADGDWEEAAERHRHRLRDERTRRAEPWTAATLATAVGEATARAIETQAGVLDLLDAGRLDEDDPVRAAARALDGCALEPGLALPLEWLGEAAPPILHAPPRLRDRRVYRHRWRAAQAWSAKPVKLSLLGPWTLAHALDDRVFGADRLAAAQALADALNPGLRDLADAGCPAVEIVEPAFVGEVSVPEEALETVARLLHRVGPDTARWLRLVAGDAVPGWQGAAPASRLDAVAGVLEDLPVDGVVAEAEPLLGAGGPVERWRRVRVAPLVVAADARPAEAVERAVAWLVEAAGRLEPFRLSAAVDGGGSRATVPLAVRLGWLDDAVRALDP